MKKLFCSLFILFQSVAFIAYADGCPEEDAFHKYLAVNINPEDPSIGTYRLHYKLQNGFNVNKQTIIMLHGGPGGGLADFEKCPGQGFCLSELSNQYNIVTVDERGAGCSLLPPDLNASFLTIATTTADIDALRRSLVGDTGRVSIFGISFGTVLGMRYAATFGDSIERLILEGSVFDHRYSLNGTWTENFNRLLDSNLTLRKDYDSLSSKLLAGKLHISSEVFLGVTAAILKSYRYTWHMLPVLVSELNRDDYTTWTVFIQKLAKASMVTSPAFKYIYCRELFDFSFDISKIEDPFAANFIGGVKEMCKDFAGTSVQLMKYSSTPDLPNINVQTLVVTGIWDSVTPANYNGRRIGASIKNSKFFEVPFAGHGVMWEQRKCDTELIGDFLYNGLTARLDQVFASDLCQTEEVAPQQWNELPVGDSLPQFKFPLLSGW